jgi:hypothetical protein
MNFCTILAFARDALPGEMRNAECLLRNPHSTFPLIAAVHRHCLTPSVGDDTKLRELFAPRMKNGHSFFVGCRRWLPRVHVSSLLQPG